MNTTRSIFAVVPIKDPMLGKTRLSPLLDARERRALCLHLARRTLDACVGAFGATRTIVVTASADIARMATEGGIQLVDEARATAQLNTAIALGADRARLAGAQVLLVVPADLALVSVAELRAAADAIPPAPGCLVVPDRRQCGTNLLGLAPLRDDLFAFGESSMRRHIELAERAGCKVRVYRNAALSLDLDLPEDYAEWQRGGGESSAYPEQAGSIRA